MDKKPVFNKRLVIGILVMFIGMSVNPSTGTISEKTTSATLGSRGYIQDLIDSASDGDTIYIPSGTYYENIKIDKSINLIGEDKNTTIIDGGGSGDVVLVHSADWVNVKGFKIQNSGEDKTGLVIGSMNNPANHILIEGNILTNNGYGTYVAPDVTLMSSYTTVKTAKFTSLISIITTQMMNIVSI